MIDFITLTGGVVAEPETKTIQSGAVVTKFRIAQSDKKKNEQDQWDTTQSLYLNVVIWDDNPQWKKNPIKWAQLASTLVKGERVAVHGKLVTNTWENQAGEKRSQIELKADSLFTVPQLQNDNGGPPPQGGFGQQQQSTGGFGQQQGGWGQASPTGGQSAEDEPPF